MTKLPRSRLSRLTQITNKAADFTVTECIAPAVVMMVILFGILYLVGRGILPEKWRDAVFDYVGVEQVTMEPMPTFTVPPTMLYLPYWGTPATTYEALGYEIGTMLVEVDRFMPVLCDYIDDHPADFADTDADPLRAQCAAYEASDSPFYVDLIEAICPVPAARDLLVVRQADFPRLHERVQNTCPILASTSTAEP